MFTLLKNNTKNNKVHLNNNISLVYTLVPIIIYTLKVEEYCRVDIIPAHLL